jgi:surfactin family lipopeptide synthetase C
MNMENVEDIYPLSPLQQGLLFHTLNAPDSGVYFQQYSCLLRGALDKAAFQEAWQYTLSQHPILRSAFLWEGLDEPLQVVRNQATPDWQERDWQTLAATDQQEQLTVYLKKDRRRGFEVAQAPLMRFALMRLEPELHRLVWSYHHLLSDGWSTLLIVKQVRATYESLRNRAQLQSSTARPYRDYISWLQQQDREEAAGFWRKRLAGFDAPTPLGLDRASAAYGRQNEYGQETIELPAAKTQILADFARTQRLTLNTLVQGAWAWVLSRCSGETDLVFGTTVSGRPVDLAGVEDMVGPFINTLPVRVQVDPQDQLVPWLEALQKQLVEMRQYEYSPLVDIQGFGDVPRGQPLFESIVVFENYPNNPNAKAADGQLELEQITYLEQSNYPLAILAVPGETLRLIAIFNGERFAADAIMRLLSHMATVLEQMAADPAQRLEQVPLLSAAQRHQILIEWNQTQTEPPAVSCWHQLFEDQARRSPDALAVACGRQELSYRQLNRRANRLAHRLRRLGVGPEVPVGLCAERSVDALVGVLGVLKSGGAYVPLDPSYPQERLDLVLDDAPIAVLVAQEKLEERVTAYSGPVVLLEEDLDETDKNPPCLTEPDHLAYAIYTSGSTGRPRAVAVTHANLLASTWARTQYYPRPVRRFLLLSNFGFDSSVAGIFWTLCQGGALYIPDQKLYADVSHLANLIQGQRISHLLCVPSLYQYLLTQAPTDLAGLETAIVAGEPCPPALVEAHYKALPDTALFNEYGPTEATVWSTVFACTAKDNQAAVPIGRPVANTRVYVLGLDMEPVPVGVPGQLYIGGAGVARGYLNQPQLTRERFVADPFAADPLAAGQDKTARLYRTGDWVRYRTDGNLEFIGRRDGQVKIRGHRVELGEIETALATHEAVGNVVVSQAEYTNDAKVNKTTDDNTDSLMQRLLSLGRQEADLLLTSVEQGNDEEAPETESNTVHRADFDLVLHAKKNRFIDPPRPAQRQWLMAQALSEFADDLEHLDAVSRRFVSGAEAKLDAFDISQSQLDDQHIMEDWQTPLMRAMAAQVAHPDGEILEIGFGRGVSAEFIQELGVGSHTIIESNSHSVERHYRPWRRRHAERDIHLIQGRWQDVEDQIGLYDGIFFHAFPLNEKEFVEYVIDSVTFAEHFFPTAAAHLRPGGAFTYLSTEIDSLSRRHQRLLLRHFTSLSLSVEKLEIPADTQDTWWADSMVIVKAVK